MTKQERILIVDDEEQMRDLLVKVLEKNGYQVAVSGDGAQALAFLEKEPVDLVVTDVRMPGMSGMEALRAIKELNPEIVVIIMTAFGSIDQAVQAVKEGAYDYINKPFKIDEMLLTIEKALEERRLRHEVTTLRQELRTRYRFENLIGKSRAMQEVFSLIEQVAGSRSTVMIYGKSGTGKELVAKAVHYNSPRLSKAFVAVNCAAIPSELLESELFGHEKGSFTGAVATKVGKFELATGGSLFLDEVGSMRLDLQAKILRALQEREVERVGGTRTIKIDVRVIAATNRDLKKAVDEGTFREDLYYRLNVVPITLPDLKDRQEDIPLLANHFMQKFSMESNPNIREISKEAMAILLSYSWPGNVRELENVIERAVTLGRDPAIQPGDLPPHLAGGADPLERALAKEATLEDLERDYIGVILRRTKGHQIRAASILGIDRRTLYRKIRRYSIKLGEE
ncbi:MAG TPA: sigma-54 dependent transcriptional regulator [Candidatus Methylomirabilis sp.]|nr:sigma-54 dependent transcriptional regulator [Candidatus Methylomirabilis sp.]HSC70587.1 sigma-54 dependent transcriptional regulator [Candidatus Methylomirabilis sp.]